MQVGAGETNKIIRVETQKVCIRGLRNGAQSKNYCKELEDKEEKEENKDDQRFSVDMQVRREENSQNWQK